MEKVKKIGRIVISVVLWVVIIAAALFSFTTLATRDEQHVANLFGYTPMSVQSNSMMPVFEKGDLIFINTCDAAKLEVGDIICFHTILEDQYVLNTHRIAAIEELDGLRRYTTRGDNNAVDDAHAIMDADIVGQYVGKLGGVGAFMDFLTTGLGCILIIVVPLFLFFLYQVYRLIVAGMRLKQAKEMENVKAEVNAANEEKNEAQRAREEAEAALAEAKRLKAEAEAALAEAKDAQSKQD